MSDRILPDLNWRVVFNRHSSPARVQWANPAGASQVTRVPLELRPTLAFWIMR